MTDTHTQVLVLTDQDGNYYLLSRDLLEASRVPAEDKAVLGDLITGDDARGFAAGAGAELPSLTPLGTLVTARKAGKGQQEYMVIKLTDLLVTSF